MVCRGTKGFRDKKPSLLHPRSVLSRAAFHPVIHLEERPGPFSSSPAVQSDLWAHIHTCRHTHTLADQYGQRQRDQRPSIARALAVIPARSLRIHTACCHSRHASRWRPRSEICSDFVFQPDEGVKCSFVGPANYRGPLGKLKSNQLRALINKRPDPSLT